MANPDTVKGIAADNLTIRANNAQTGVYNSGTNLLTSSIGYGVSENNYDAAYKAADAAYKSNADIQTITAQYGPAVTKMALELRLQEGLITREQFNQEMDRLRNIAQYVGPTAAANARADYITAQNNVGQAGVNGKVINQQNKTFELTNQLAQLTQAYQTEVALAGPNTKRAMDLARRISEVQTKLAQAAGVTGSIAPYTPTPVPVVDPSTGVYLGSMDTTTGAVTRASTTGTPLIASGTPTTQQTTTATHYLPNGQRVGTSTPVRTSNIPTTTGTRAVVTNNPLGGHNYTGNVSNWDALLNSDAGQFIQNLFFRK